MHRGPIAGISAFGPWVATAGYDNLLILWEAASRRAVSRACHDHLVNSCEFSHDGSLLVSASSDYSARIWEVPSLRLKVALTGHADDVDMAAFSPDDARVATCALDRKLRIFDLTGKCLAVLEGHTGNILSLAWSGDGSRIVSSSVDGTLREWDAATGREIRCNDIGVRTDTVQVDASGRIIAGDDRGRIVLAVEGKLHAFDAHRAGIKKLVFEEESGILVSLSYDRSLAIWMSRGTSLVELARSELPACVWARAAALCGKHRVAAGTFGSTYGLYDWSEGKWDLAGWKPDESLNAVAVSEEGVHSIGDAGMLFTEGVPQQDLGSLCNFLLPFGGKLLAGGQLGVLYDAKTGESLHIHHSPLNCAASFFRSGMPHVVVGTYTGEILAFAEEGGAFSFVGTLKVYGNAVKGLAVSRNRIFSVCASTDIAWHDISDFSLVRRVEQAHERIANACCPAGEDGFASVGRDRVLRIWTSGSEEAHPSPHPNSVKCIAASADGRILMTGAYSGTLAGFDLKTRCWMRMTRPTASGISSIAYHPGGFFVASAYDGRIYRAQIQ